MNHVALDATLQVTAPRRILAVFNPAAGRNRRSRFELIVSALRDMGCAVSVVETTAPGHAEAIARTASAAEFDVIAAAGGDGTVNEIVNGLSGKALTLGIIPIGTANVLADEINLSRTPAKIARAIAFGAAKPICVGVANGRRFVMMAGIGFDANVVSRVSVALKKRLGPFAYVWQAVIQGFKDPFACCDVIVDGKSYQTVSAVACNGQRYGGPFIAAPDSALTDDQFHVVLMKGRGWFSVLRYGLALMLGRIARLSDVEVVVGREVTVQGRAGQPVQADGDIITTLPLRISVDPQPVYLIYPN